MRSRPDQRPDGRENSPSKQQRFSPNNQTFDSHGPSIKIRGSAYDIYQRYLALARKATASGDRIAAENLYQHAEHYFRMGKARRDAGQGEVRPEADTHQPREEVAAELSEPGGFGSKPQWDSSDTGSTDTITH
jgi:hypothetical protein